MRLVLGLTALALAFGSVQGGHARTTSGQGDGGDVVTLAELPPLGGGDQDRPHRLVPAAEQYGREHADVYAGLVLGAGHLYVGFTKDAALHLSRLRQQVDSPDVLRAFRAKYTVQQFERTVARVTTEMKSLNQEGIPVTAVGMDMYHNRVVISLAGRDERQEAALRDRYGPLLAFDEGIWVAAGG